MKPLQISQLKSIYDMLSLKGKTAFVTGGAGGIGRSCAAALAEAGADVVLMDICARKRRWMPIAGKLRNGMAAGRRRSQAMWQMKRMWNG